MSYKSSGKKLATNDTFVFQREMELRKEGVFTAHWSPENGIKTRKRLEKQFYGLVSSGRKLPSLFSLS